MCYLKALLCVISHDFEKGVSLEIEWCFLTFDFQVAIKLNALVSLFTFPLVLILGSPKQSRGLITADVGYQISLSSHVSFYPLSPCSGNDRDPQQFQARLSQ